jgi:hypothetical protein
VLRDRWQTHIDAVTLSEQAVGVGVQPKFRKSFVTLDTVAAVAPESPAWAASRCIEVVARYSTPVRRTPSYRDGSRRHLDAAGLALAGFDDGSAARGLRRKIAGAEGRPCSAPSLLRAASSLSFLP